MLNLRLQSRTNFYLHVRVVSDDARGRAGDAVAVVAPRESADLCVPGPHDAPDDDVLEIDVRVRAGSRDHDVLLAAHRLRVSRSECGGVPTEDLPVEVVGWILNPSTDAGGDSRFVRLGCTDRSVRPAPLVATTVDGQRQFLFARLPVHFGRGVRDERRESAFCLRWLNFNRDIDSETLWKRNTAINREIGILGCAERAWHLYPALPRGDDRANSVQLWLNGARVSVAAKLHEGARVSVGAGMPLELHAHLLGRSDSVSGSLIAEADGAPPSLVLRRVNNEHRDSYCLLGRLWEAGPAGSEVALAGSGVPPGALLVRDTEEGLVATTRMEPAVGTVLLNDTPLDPGCLYALPHDPEIEVRDAGGDAVLRVCPVRAGETKRRLEEHGLGGTGRSLGSETSAAQRASTRVRVEHEKTRAEILSRVPATVGDPAPVTWLSVASLVENLRDGVRHSALQGILSVGRAVATEMDMSAIEMLAERVRLARAETIRQIDQFLGEDVAGVALADLLGQPGREIVAARNRLAAALERFGGREDPSRVAAELVSSAEGFLDSLALVRRHVLQRRENLGAVVRSAMDAEAPRFEAMHIALGSPAASDATVRAFLDTEKAESAIVHVLRVARDHVHPSGEGAGCEVCVSDSPDSVMFTDVVVSAHPGSGGTPDCSVDRNALADVRRVVEDVHGGQLEVDEGRELRVIMRFPRQVWA